jgi:hypothetical protein
MSRFLITGPANWGQTSLSEKTKLLSKLSELGFVEGEALLKDSDDPANGTGRSRARRVINGFSPTHILILQKNSTPIGRASDMRDEAISLGHTPVTVDD